jgi:hypothetical protein
VVAGSLAAAGAAMLAGCRRFEPRRLDPVRALRSRVAPRFRAPSDGLVTEAQIQTYLTVRRAAGSASDTDAARALKLDPAEFLWVRARLIEALMALDGQEVIGPAIESYTRAIATLREARLMEKDARAAARLDAEIATLERERGSLHSPDAGRGVAVNAARARPYRAAIESVGP